MIGPLPRWSRPRPLGRVPTVSVIVPCYNYGRFLPTCVGSVLQQPGVEVDVLIIDDASPDGSAEVAAQLASTDSRVKLIRHSQNQGHIRTYNEGLALVRGDYVVLLSADDALTPGALARATALMESDPTVGLVYGHPVSTTSADFPPARTRVTSWSTWSGPRWIETMCRSGVSNISSPEAVVRREIQDRVGGYRLDLPHSGDLEMWIRIASVSNVGRINGADQAYYRVHANSMYRTLYASQISDLRERRAAFQTTFDEGPASQLSNKTALLQQAYRALAVGALRHAIKVLDLGTEEVGNIAPYIDFALETYSGTRDLSEWRKLSRRRRLGDQKVSRSFWYGRRYWIYDIESRVRWRIRRMLGI